MGIWLVHSVCMPEMCKIDLSTLSSNTLNIMQGCASMAVTIVSPDHLRDDTNAFYFSLTGKY